MGHARRSAPASQSAAALLYSTRAVPTLSCVAQLFALPQTDLAKEIHEIINAATVEGCTEDAKKQRCDMHASFFQEVMQMKAHQAQELKAIEQLHHDGGAWNAARLCSGVPDGRVSVMEDEENESLYRDEQADVKAKKLAQQVSGSRGAAR